MALNPPVKRRLHHPSVLKQGFPEPPPKRFARNLDSTPGPFRCLHLPTDNDPSPKDIVTAYRKKAKECWKSRLARMAKKHSKKALPRLKVHLTHRSSCDYISSSEDVLMDMSEEWPEDIMDDVKYSSTPTSAADIDMSDVGKDEVHKGEIKPSVQPPLDGVMDGIVFTGATLCPPSPSRSPAKEHPAISSWRRPLIGAVQNRPAAGVPQTYTSASSGAVPTQQTTHRPEAGIVTSATESQNPPEPENTALPLDAHEPEDVVSTARSAEENGEDLMSTLPDEENAERSTTGKEDNVHNNEAHETDFESDTPQASHASLAQEAADHSHTLDEDLDEAQDVEPSEGPEEINERSANDEVADPTEAADDTIEESQVDDNAEETAEDASIIEDDENRDEDDGEEVENGEQATEDSQNGDAGGSQDAGEIEEIRENEDEEHGAGDATAEDTKQPPNDEEDVEAASSHKEEDPLEQITEEEHAMFDRIRRRENRKIRKSNRRLDRLKQLGQEDTVPEADPDSIPSMDELLPQMAEAWKEVILPCMKHLEQADADLIAWDVEYPYMRAFFTHGILPCLQSLHRCTPPRVKRCRWVETGWDVDRLWDFFNYYVDELKHCMKHLPAEFEDWHQTLHTFLMNHVARVGDRKEEWIKGAIEKQEARKEADDVFARLANL